MTTSALTTDTGLRVHPDFLDAPAQRALLEEVRAIIAEAPLYAPVVPGSGRPMSVRMTNCGPLGWYTDREGGYRYVARHPETGRPWPPIPATVLAIWEAVADYPQPPEACLVNYYGPEARMGLHRDQDEDAADAPVVSISLGDSALFRIGGPTRKGPTRSLKLASGAVVVLGGQARHCYHGVDRIIPGTSRLVAEGGRFNLTLRRVTRPAM
jgi:alkylated DNA repair protein (DNA oxidative demethylase)